MTRCIRKPLYSPILAGAIALACLGPTAAPASPDVAQAARYQARHDQFIVRFKDGTPERNDAGARQRLLDAVGQRRGLRLGHLRRMSLGADVIRVDHKLDAVQSKALVLALLANPRVEYAEADLRMYPALNPNDASYPQQWHYFEATAGINAPAAWDVTTGTGQKVAVLDTGITVHADLGTNIVGGYDFIADPATANDGGGRDADPSDPGDWTVDDECDVDVPGRNSSWHGTHVSGTVAALTHNVTGVAGVAHGGKVVPVRVLGKCGGLSTDIAEAIIWASGGAVAGVPANANPAKVINLSLGGLGACGTTTQNAINAAVANGATVVVAAGNDNSDASAFNPANCANVITVGAVDRNGARASYSNFGSTIDLTAPGGGGGQTVLSTVDTGTTVPVGAGYAGFNGTSMATPHVAGVAALVRAAGGSGLTPAQMEHLLKVTTRTQPIACPQGCGTGLLDAAVAVTAATQPILTITDAADVAEGNSGTHTVTFTVNLSAAVGSNVTFNIATGNGTAAAGSDFVAKTSTAQVITAGTTSKTFVVTVNGDGTGELDETFFANVTAVTGPVLAVDTQGVGIIINDDPLVLSNGVPFPGIHGVEQSLLAFTMAVPSGATNLNFTTSGGTGDADLLVNFGAPATFGDRDCDSAAIGNTELCSFPTPSAGTWYLTLFAFDPYEGLTLTGTYTIPNTLSVNDVSVVEGLGGTRTATFTVTLSPVSGSTVTYDIATANASAVAPTDYVAKTSVGESIAAGVASKTFVVTLNGDATTEPNETFTVNLSNASGAAIGDAQGVGTILNDDGPTVSVADVAVAEGNSGSKLLTFTVKLSQAAAGPVTYTATTSNGSAFAPGDYTASSLAGQTIATGQLSKTFAVTVLGDATAEPNESFAVTLSAVTGASVLDDRAVGTILNDDSPRVSIADVSVAEGNAGTKLATFTVLLTPASASPVTYNIATANANALAGSDYVAAALTGETLAPGATSRTFQVTLNGDAAIEANEVFYVNLSAVSGATVFDGQASGVVLNDDGPVLTMQDAVVTEGNAGTALATYTVKLSQAMPGPVTYTIATANGTALAGTDYVATTLVGETIAAGMLSKTFSVPVNGDTTVEPNETIYANLSSATGGATLLDAQGVAYLINDDGPTLSIGDANVAEGNAGTKTLTFTVSLSQAAAVPVTYNIATGNGTALAGSDYVASSLTGQSIPPGQLGKTFVVTINGDTAVEANELFSVAVTTVAGATVADGSALGRIDNDD